ncbi:hypothetical protein QBC39DRAFT_349884 [Podospora conica]|nr:hypothetical protein QBC39DRAFT_349884 [Schizothecium conicum]
MDPLSIISASVGLAGAIAKVSMALTSFARDARDAAEDLDNISAELQALRGVIDPLARSLSSSGTESSIPEILLQEIDVILVGTAVVVEQIEENVEKYKRNKVFSKAGWVMFGQADMRKLRESLGHYKLALSLGMHVVSTIVNQAVKEDTTVIREQVVAIKTNTEEILARVDSIRRDGQRSKHKRVEDWIEDMSMLNSYAETAYQETINDPADMAAIAESLPRVSEDLVVPRSPGVFPTDLIQQPATALSRETGSMGPSTQPVARPTLDEITGPSTASGPATAPSAESPDSNHLTSALATKSDDIDNLPNQLSLLGWKNQILQEPFGQAFNTEASLVFRTALRCFQHSNEPQVSGGQPPEPHHYCEVSLFECCPTEASAMSTALSYVFFTVSFSPKASGSPPTPGDLLFSVPERGWHNNGSSTRALDFEIKAQGIREKTTLTFFDTRSLGEFRGNLVGSSTRLDETKHEFPLEAYAASQWWGFVRPTFIEKVLTLKYPWSKVLIFESSASEPRRRIVLESKDGLTFLNNWTGASCHTCIALGSVETTDHVLEISRSRQSYHDNLLFTGSPESIQAGRITGERPQQHQCEYYKFQDLLSLHRFQQIMTGYAVLFDGWTQNINFGRQNFGFFKMPKEVHWGKSVTNSRVQIIQGTKNGETQVAIFSPPSRRHLQPSHTNFRLSQHIHRVHYFARTTVAITDDISTLPSDTIAAAWDGVSPDDKNPDLLDPYKPKTGKSNKLFFRFKSETGKQSLLCGHDLASSWC